MGLVQKFRDRVEKSTSIEELEIVAEDFRRVSGLTEDEKEKISKTLEDRFQSLSVESSFDDDMDEMAHQALEEIRKEKEKPLTKTAVVVRDMAEKYNLPPGFILTFEDPKTGRISPYVTKPGLLYKLKQVGFRAVQVRFVKDDAKAGVYECEAAIYPNLSPEDYNLLHEVKEMGDKSLFRETFEELTRPTIHRGRASPETLKEKQVKWAKEMAETRATLRAARIFTGCGLYLEEEVREDQGGAA